MMIVPSRISTSDPPRSAWRQTLKQRATAYRGKQDFDRAIADPTQTMMLNPSDAEAFLERGSAHEWKGDYDSAVAVGVRP
jgi:hypothetical protein